MKAEYLILFVFILIAIVAVNYHKIKSRIDAKLKGDVSIPHRKSKSIVDVNKDSPEEPSERQPADLEPNTEYKLGFERSDLSWARMRSKVQEWTPAILIAFGFLIGRQLHLFGSSRLLNALVGGIIGLVVGLIIWGIRKLSAENDSKPVQEEQKEVQSTNLQSNLESDGQKTMGFGWGKFWIVMGFWFGGIALVFGFMLGKSTEYIPNRGIALTIALLGIGSAIGLLLRRKFGLYLVFVTLFLNMLGGLLMIIEGSTSVVIQGVLILPISLLWFKYFRKRRDLFK